MGGVLRSAPAAEKRAPPPPTACPPKPTTCPGTLDIFPSAGYTGHGKRKGDAAVKVEIRIDKSLAGPEAVIRAPAATPEVLALAERLRGEGRPSFFTAFRGNEAVALPLGDILRFYADGKGVSCRTGKGTFTVRQRLYELEEAFAGTRVVRVSNSEMVNLDRVTALDLSLTGTIRMTLADGAATAYASRRYVKKIKEAVGL